MTWGLGKPQSSRAGKEKTVMSASSGRSSLPFERKGVEKEQLEINPNYGSRREAETRMGKELSEPSIYNRCGSGPIPGEAREKRDLAKGKWFPRSGGVSIFKHLTAAATKKCHKSGRRSIRGEN